MPGSSREIVGMEAVEFNTRFQRGAVFYSQGAYREALAEFEDLLQAAPGNIEIRVWVRKTREALTGDK